MHTPILRENAWCKAPSNFLTGVTSVLAVNSNHSRAYKNIYNSKILAASYPENISYFKVKMTVASAQQRKKDYPVELIEIFASSI